MPSYLTIDQVKDRYPCPRRAFEGESTVNTKPPIDGYCVGGALVRVAMEADKGLFFPDADKTDADLGLE